MKRVFCKVLCLGMLLFLTGCISAVDIETSDSSGEKESGETVQEDVSKQLDTVPFEAGEVQYVSDVTLREDGTLLRGLQIRDLKVEGDWIPLCNRPGCSHGKDEKDCLQQRFSSVNFAAIMDTHLVLNVRVNDCYEVYHIDLADGDIKQLYIWDGDRASITKAVLVGEYLYFFATEEQRDVTEDGYEEITAAKGYLYGLHMKSGEMLKLYETEKYYGMSGAELFYSQGKLAIVMLGMQQKSFEEAGITYEEYTEIIMTGDLEKYLELFERLGTVDKNLVYDLETGKVLEKQVDLPGWENAPAAGFWNGELIFTDMTENKTLYRLGMEDEIPEVWLENTQIMYNQYADFIMIKMRGSSGLFSYYVCKEDSFEPEKLELPKENYISIVYESPTQVYLAWQPQADSSTSEEYTYELINKSTFFEWIKG